MGSVCEACGSPDVHVERFQGSVSMPYGPTLPYEADVLRCASCAEVSDPLGNERRAYVATRAQVAQESVRMILRYLKRKHGMRDAHLERALELPLGTLTRWRRGTVMDLVSHPAANLYIPPEVLPLLRILRTFPSMVDFADEHLHGGTPPKEIVP